MSKVTDVEVSAFSECFLFLSVDFVNSNLFDDWILILFHLFFLSIHQSIFLSHFFLVFAGTMYILQATKEDERDDYACSECILRDQLAKRCQWPQLPYWKVLVTPSTGNLKGICNPYYLPNDFFLIFCSICFLRWLEAFSFQLVDSNMPLDPSNIDRISLLKFTLT